MSEFDELAARPSVPRAARLGADGRVAEYKDPERFPPEQLAARAELDLSGQRSRDCRARHRFLIAERAKLGSLDELS